MMKKCYYFLMVALMALVSVGFAACGDDDEPEGSDIVGTWLYNDTDMLGTGVTLFQFTKNGQFHEVDKYLYDGETEIDVYHGTYSVSGNKLTVTYIFTYETETSECTYKVKGDKLTITYEESSRTLTRVQDSEIEKYL